MRMCGLWWLHRSGKWGQNTPLSEHVYCVAIAFKMTEWVEQWICIRFCVMLNILPWKLFQWSRRLQLWATGDWQLHHDNVPAHAEFFGKASSHPGDSAPPYSPDLVSCNFWLFPKLKSPLKGKRFQTIDEIQEDMMRQLMGIRRTVWGSKVPTLKGTESSLSCV